MASCSGSISSSNCGRFTTVSRQYSPSSLCWEVNSAMRLPNAAVRLPATPLRPGNVRLFTGRTADPPPPSPAATLDAADDVDDDVDAAEIDEDDGGAVSSSVDSVMTAASSDSSSSSRCSSSSSSLWRWSEATEAEGGRVGRERVAREELRASGVLTR